jgi:diguanylate cyclase (GGDEF)-like protein
MDDGPLTANKAATPGDACVAAEQRRYTRYQIKLPAQLECVGEGRCDCMVRDYCSGGMLVHQERARTDAIELQVGQSVTLDTVLLTGPSTRRVRIRATVAWSRDGYFGVTFPAASDAIVEALQRHHRLARADQDSDRGRARGGEARCLARFRHAAKRVLPAMLRALLEKTQAELVESADRVASNVERQQVFGDLNALDGLRDDDSLIRAVLERALERADAAPLRDTPLPGELTLVDPDDFERWLEASRVATALERRFSGQLTAIGSRMAALRGGSAQDDLTVPFEPRHFTAALKDIARQLELGTTTRDVLFDSASLVLAEHLGGLYADLDAVLEAVGAPPAQLHHQVGIRRPATGPAQERRGDQEADDAPAPSTTQVPDTAAHAPAAADGELVAVDLDLLHGLLARERQQRETLAHEMMTEVAETPNISDSMASWLQQLNGALVQQAVADQQFFQNGRHPLREIVDALGHLQMFRAGSDDDPADEPLRQRVSGLLESISAGDADARLLRAVADEVAQLTSEQSRQYQRNVERVVESSQGRDRVRRARMAVANEINRRYAGRQVPEVIADLVEVGWRAVLELAWLNATEESAAYDDRLALLDNLVAALGGDAFAPDAPRFERSVMLARVEGELATAAFDPFRRNAVEARLRRELSGPKSARGRLVEMPTLDDGAGVTESLRPEGVSEQTWTESLDNCAAIRIGDRLRFLDVGDGRQELRVAWIRDDGGVFVLVDHRGLKARGIPLDELALGLLQRRIQLDVADGQPISERAVDAILGRMQEQLAHQTAHDSLTGLIDRRQFQAAMEQALAMPGRSNDQGVLLWLDLDQFRLVNDIHGYDTGDRLLVATARLLERSKGAKVLAHLGGDRFAALLPDIGIDDGENWAQHLCDSIRGMPFDWHGQPIGLSVSVGVVELQVARDGVGQALQAADNALAAAKAQGGGQVYVYQADDPDITRYKESAHWAVQVDEALDRGALHLRCQPIVPVRPDAGLTPHYEVLLGVASGSEQPLPVAEFIEAAERYNRMRAVDRWVTKTVIDWIVTQREQMPALHGFAVNLSGQTASDPSFVDFVRQQFQRAGIDPSWVSFEVTETAAVADLSRTAGIIQELKALGCKVALDDFGSGLASYSYLKELPVDWLKIDGVFVRKIAASMEDRAVVKSINEIGHFLGKKTIAEYVVDDQVLRLVREMGVDFAQGFGISKPILMDDLAQSLPERVLPVRRDAG